MRPRTRVYVAGGRTLLGRALIDLLRQDVELVGLPPHEPDLLRPDSVESFFHDLRPEYVFMAAGPSGGIAANQRYPADLMRDNLLIAAHVLDAAFRHRVKKLLYVGASCSYPRDAAQPLRPESLQTGAVEPTSEAYATAKLAGLRLCQAYRRQHGAAFIAAIPANVYGSDDDFDPATGHVIPALIRRMHDAKERGDGSLLIWGDGSARREFLHARDAASACLCAMNHYDHEEPINLGAGDERSIAEIAQLIARTVGYRGQLRFDFTRPAGMPRKCLDSSTLYRLGWTPSVDLRTGLEETYAWFQSRPHTPCAETHAERAAYSGLGAEAA